MVVDSGTSRANVSPAKFFMKTCIVDSGSTDDARDDTGESEQSEAVLLERMLCAG